MKTSSNLHYYTGLLLLLLCLVNCTGKQQTWYREGGSQRLFDLDARECQVIAEQQARARGATGRSTPPEAYAVIYQRCIVAKGWRTTPSAKAPAPVAAAPLAETDDNALTAFGRRLTLPAAYHLQSHTTRRLDSSRFDTAIFLAADGSAVNIIAQESGRGIFLSQSYAVPAPYRVYATGDSGALHWAGFWGETENGWVGGIGASILLSKKERFIVVVTTPLPPPHMAPPPGLTLSANQHRQLQTFIGQWRPWLTANTPKPGPIALIGGRLRDILVPF